MIHLFKRAPHWVLVFRKGSMLAFEVCRTSPFRATGTRQGMNKGHMQCAPSHAKSFTRGFQVKKTKKSFVQMRLSILMLFPEIRSTVSNLFHGLTSATAVEITQPLPTRKTWCAWHCNKTKCKVRHTSVH